MEAYTKLVIVALVLAAAIVNNEPMVANGLSICSMTEDGLRSCEPSVSGQNPAPPSATCCTALSKADLKCLCSYKNLLPSLGIDPNQAMQLPAKCNMAAPVNC
ncbi:hypothetical protein L1049_015809 [Liquidambar formosana]|uniref:Bifunctional inhibitor/plant lipid transfer protein/seed storage helical domain-containing protein n=1 Tax=Liquidambar formosana TaxID=63359 RepID=A0AAP0RYD3_LIQFO